VGRPAIPLTGSVSRQVNATGVGAAIDVGEHEAARLKLTAAAVGGTTPSVTVAVQTSSDSGSTDGWRTVGTFPAVTANGSSHLDVGPLDRFIRLSYTVTGTGATATLTVTGELVGGTV
jgi:hypothetical protein